jgi:predicted aldo/keto reductase-like oxidoreductase
LAGSEDQLDLENPNGNAAICTECGVCVEKCPQEINIPIDLKKVHAVLGRRESIIRHFG